VIWPGGEKVSWEQLQHPDNAIVKLMEKVQADAKEQYIVVMARPGSLKFYRSIRNMIAKRPIDVGYDAVDADFEVNWDEAKKALGVAEE
jgi:arabinogalactan endo-1,4-beta-galactosidase